MNTTTPNPIAPSQIPAMLLTPIDWALETQRLASEYCGLPEGKEFLVTSRRFLALAARIAALENQVLDLGIQLVAAKKQ